MAFRLAQRYALHTPAFALTNHRLAAIKLS
jgi:hypothetical protein